MIYLLVDSLKCKTKTKRNEEDGPELWDNYKGYRVQLMVMS